MNRKDILIVIGHDGSRMYGDIAEVNILNLQKFGYDYILEDFSDTGRHPWFAKAGVLQDAMNKETHPWVVWMDADSIMVNPFDELFENDDHDVGILVKERDRYDKGISRSTPHGDYLYSHLIGLKSGEPARFFLEEWIRVNKIAQGRESDLKGVHRLLESLMDVDARLFDCIDKVIPNSHFNLKIYDPYIYGSMGGIIDMLPWEDRIKVLHFKGRALKRAWYEYKEKVLCL